MAWFKKKTPGQKKAAAAKRAKNRKQVKKWVKQGKQWLDERDKNQTARYKEKTDRLKAQTAYEKARNEYRQVRDAQYGGFGGGQSSYTGYKGLGQGYETSPIAAKPMKRRKRSGKKRK